MRTNRGWTATAAATCLIAIGACAGFSAPAQALGCEGPTRLDQGGALELAADCDGPGAELGARKAAEVTVARLADRLDVDPSGLDVTDVSRSPAGEYVRYQQYFGGVPVFNGELVVTLDEDNDAAMVLSETIAGPPADLEPALSRSSAIRRARSAVAGDDALLADPEAELVVYPVREERPRLAWHVTLVTDEFADWSVIVDANAGAVLDSWDAAKEEFGAGFVFSPNPVQKTGQTSLTDGGDAASPALDSARSAVPLSDLSPGVFNLRGAYADLSAPGLTGCSLPYNPGSALDLNRNYFYDRDDDRFEEVSVYFAITEVQKLIQSLGFTAVNNRSVPVNVHCFPDRAGVYSRTTGGLYFGDGDGNVDYAEDGDVVVHEYGHAIQDDQVPDFAPKSKTEQAAIGEGFGDLLAALFYFNSGDPGYESAYHYCVGDWIATGFSPVVPGQPTSGCFRWVNGIVGAPRPRHRHLLGNPGRGALRRPVLVGGDDVRLRGHGCELRRPQSAPADDHRLGREPAAGCRQHCVRGSDRCYAGCGPLTHRRRQRPPDRRLRRLPGTGTCARDDDHVPAA